MRARLSALWVRNVIGAVVVAVAVGVVVTTILGDQWATYRHTVVPEHRCARRDRAARPAARHGRSTPSSI